MPSYFCQWQLSVLLCIRSTLQFLIFFFNFQNLSSRKRIYYERLTDMRDDLHWFLLQKIPRFDRNNFHEDSRVARSVRDARLHETGHRLAVPASRRSSAERAYSRRRTVLAYPRHGVSLHGPHTTTL